MDEWARFGTAKHLKSGNVYGVWCRIDDDKYVAIYNVVKGNKPPKTNSGYYNKQSVLDLKNLVEVENL